MAFRDQNSLVCDLREKPRVVHLGPVLNKQNIVFYNNISGNFANAFE